MDQCASAVILVRPTGFGFDEATATSNAFQRRELHHEEETGAALEFDRLLEALRQCGVRMSVLDPADPHAPNAVFPNNWFSTHADGTVVIYPMLTASRRSERDPRLTEHLAAEGFRVERIRDISGWEQEGRILEGTGSLVLDRLNRVVYACLSPRTTEQAARDLAGIMGYAPVLFSATMDGTISGDPVYHTNVVMSVGERFAVVCLDALPYPAERIELREELERTGREVIPISIDQMHRYVGNMLELRSAKPIHAGQGVAGGSFIFLSTTAFNALDPEQRRTLQGYAQLVPVDIPTIEQVGGGSVRCMLAENFLPLRS